MDTMTSSRRWVAMGSAGAVGSIHETSDGFVVRLHDGSPDRAYPSLEVAKSAVLAALPTGADRPEFREH